MAKHLRVRWSRRRPTGACVRTSWPLCLGLLLAAIAPSASSAPADRLIPAHGQYSQAYQSDWSTLPTAKALAAWDTTKLTLQDVAGEKARRVISGQPEVHLKGLRLRVSWKDPQPEK